jgi:hypothetical protein
LLDVRLCDLGVKVEGTWLQEQTERVLEELQARGIRLRPSFWLSDDWFSPTGIPGVALPFFLADPKLARLERSQMLEVEGGTPETCIRILRHEVGHAVQHAYRLQRRRRWQQLFGAASKPYPASYRPNPASRRFVLHLDAWYAQSHPEEDFAETFAVWLSPRSNWRERYRGWPALQKLQYVDTLMQEIANTAPPVRTRAKPYAMPSLRLTLGEYYKRKRAAFASHYSEAHDRDLKRLFAERSAHPNAESAASFLRRHRREVRELVAKWSGDYVFTVDQVLKDMIGRCKELKLVAIGSERRLRLDFAIMLTVHSTSYLYRGREWHSM